jgi:hypothetical protein
MRLSVSVPRFKVLPAVFDVTNVAELENALSFVRNNGQDDTINVAPKICTVQIPGISPVGSKSSSLALQGGAV